MVDDMHGAKLEACAAMALRLVPHTVVGPKLEARAAKLAFFPSSLMSCKVVKQEATTLLLMESFPHCKNLDHVEVLQFLNRCSTCMCVALLARAHGRREVGQKGWVGEEEKRRGLEGVSGERGEGQSEEGGWGKKKGVGKEKEKKRKKKNRRNNTKAIFITCQFFLTIL